MDFHRNGADPNGEPDPADASAWGGSGKGKAESEPQTKVDFNPAVADFLSATTWANLEIKPDRRLLGDVVTSSSRAFLVGSTGIGKTMFLYGMVGGMASGKGYLHWACDGPSKWLIIDGEMPSVLVKGRSTDLLRRAGPLLIPPHGVTIYSRDREDEFVEAFPHLGRMTPLNTEAGHTFVKDLIATIGGVDGVIFDAAQPATPTARPEYDRSADRSGFCPAFG
jgi:AAA domain